MSGQLVFISRHQPTNGQIATARKIGYDGIQTREIVFGDDPVAQLKAIGLDPGATVAVVAPVVVALELLRAQYGVIEFQNVPSARQRGVFLCKGAWVHTLRVSEFVPCPVPLDEQEEGSLMPAGR